MSPAAANCAVIVPVLNEADNLRRLLPILAMQGFGQTIVVDGGSRDDSVDVAHGGDAVVVTAAGGRGPQLRAGAAAAGLPYLWFLHADALPPADAVAAMAPVLAAGRAGAFNLALDHPAWRLRVVEFGARLRNALTQIPYGDQSLFLPRNLYDRVGGFLPIPIMEDIAIGRALKRLGLPVQIVPQRLHVSARRWVRDGVVRRTLSNWRLAVSYQVFGVDPRRLAERYRPEPNELPDAS